MSAQPVDVLPSTFFDLQIEERTPDDPDGFLKYVRSKISNLACAKSGEKEDSFQPAPHQYSGRSSGSDTATSPKTFYETRTALVQKEARDNTGSGDIDHGNDYSNIHDDVYDFSHANRGLAVIINNEQFTPTSGLSNRKGSAMDRDELHRTFSNFGFKVILFNNLRDWQIMKLLFQAAQLYDHTNADCFACAILSHGDETWNALEHDRLGLQVRQDLLYGAGGKAVRTKRVLEMFNDFNCPGLKGKPRLFFFQACRGDRQDDGQTVEVQIPRKRTVYAPGVPFVRSRSAVCSAKGVDSVDASPLKADCPDARPEDYMYANPYRSGQPLYANVQNLPVSPAPLYKDCLVMYATPPGHFAWRNEANGSWFVQSLCRVLGGLQQQNHSQTRSLLRALTAVTGLVARNFQSHTPDNPDTDGKKETPVIESKLTKDIFLCRKNHRVLPRTVL